MKGVYVLANAGAFFGARIIVLLRMDTTQEPAIGAFIGCVQKAIEISSGVG
jgi:hypothetical protein